MLLLLEGAGLLQAVPPALPPALLVELHSPPKSFGPFRHRLFTDGAPPSLTTADGVGLFISGLPDDVDAREIHNLFRRRPGFDSCQLKYTGRANQANALREIMGSLSKRQKLSEEQYIDRISNLPNGLVTQILSCLPTKYAVATSALSTRWKQLWTSITSLDFDDELLVHPQNQSGNPAVQRSFTSFVCQVFMLRRDSAVHRFRLKLNRTYDVSCVNGWIGDMLLHNVREIDLSIRRKDSTLLPQELFTCVTLVVLKLDIDCNMNVPTSVSLPNLKILHFVCITFVDDDSINRFLLGCPVLEELNMTACVGEGVSVINVVAPMLTSFNMLNVISRHYMKPHHDFEGRIVLDTPALLYLTIFDSCADGFVVGSLPHLIKADITIIAEDHTDPHISEAITDLLKGISNVRFLHLADFSLEV
ncbi:hypothetical protein RHGRI_000628 [Rhododendron griersonianum]|uniref:F-box domain-containing protein n=1 Tax=Rhododendron griersonianum TaxID=479676 RepID=A0AAV6LHD4_9ERIC|nr:hypothetical protein RHGRI_000628 [Rhododendron griersonianum]